jgi:hypothetical protein
MEVEQLSVFAFGNGTGSVNGTSCFRRIKMGQDKIRQLGAPNEDNAGMF